MRRPATQEPASRPTVAGSPAEVAQAAVLWHSGCGIHAIARELGRGTHTIQAYLDEAGISDRGSRRPRCLDVVSPRAIEREVRRRRVAALYFDESVPLEDRSTRSLGERFGVSHRTIVNDLAALELEARPATPPAAGIDPEERRARVLELYPDHTCDEIADMLGTSKRPISDDVDALAAQGLLTRRAPGRRRTLPVPEARPCLYCNEPFTPTATQVKDGFGKWCERDHYDAWRSRVQDELAVSAKQLYADGLTISATADALDVGRDRVWRALRRMGVQLRPHGSRAHVKGRFVKCKAREHDFCPHGEGERWVYASHSTEFLSVACWARYRTQEQAETLIAFLRSNLLMPARERQKRIGRAAGRLGGRPRGYTSLQARGARELKANHPDLGVRRIAATTGLSVMQVRAILRDSKG